MTRTPPTQEQARSGRAAMRAKCIAVALAETPESVWLVTPRRSLTGEAYAVDRRHIIAAPRPFTRRALYVYLHEIGHVVLDHCGARDRKLKAHEREREAENFARDTMRAHGLAVPRKETQRAADYVARKKALGKKISRGRNR